MEKRFQVFVSSTYTDLIEARSEVMQALLELNCMPAGMELFPAANDDQWSWIKRVIDESDYYIVIIAGRYGSVSKKTGLSYTEMEYRYAVETGKPIIGFIHESPKEISVGKTDTSQEAQEKLTAFREFVQQRLCKFWSSPTDLGAKVSRSITQLMKQHPAIWWVRADKVAQLGTADDILKLRNELDKARKDLEALGAQIPKTFAELASGSDVYSIEFRFLRRIRKPPARQYSRVGYAWDEWAMTWDEIFRVIGISLLQNDESSWDAMRDLTQEVERKAHSMLSAKFSGEKFTEVAISSKANETIMVQLRALNLISVSSEGKWTLTPFGNTYLSRLIGVPKPNQKAEDRAKDGKPS